LSGVFHVDEVMIRVGKKPIRKCTYDFEIICGYYRFWIKKVSQRREAEDAGLGHFGFPKGLTPTPLDIIIIIYHHITRCHKQNITHR